MRKFVGSITLAEIQVSVILFCVVWATVHNWTATLLALIGPSGFAAWARATWDGDSKNGRNAPNN